MAFAAVLGITGCQASGSGSDGPEQGKGGQRSHSASGVPRTTPTFSVPDDWTEPDRWVVLPRGERTDKYGSPVGFPHDLKGAVAMFRAVQGTDITEQKNVVDEHLRLFNSYMSAEDRSADNAERVELGAMRTDKEIHRQMGVKPGGPLPLGAYVRTTVVGFKVIKSSPDEVSAWLLSRVAQKAGEGRKEEVSYTGRLMASRWEAGDWKMSTKAALAALREPSGQSAPKGAAPGDKAFNAAGWTAIREAS
ncbi:hypothetical protein [Streptomyces sp. PanSC9]|uniref:hypothetical protein n=1 Tax=Streptomyces sp. PanSC9 TaxID=1520461 RepID=UPI0021A6906B|nr:hypothetical protein [Streptomyces sp. PanSC9]